MRGNFIFRPPMPKEREELKKFTLTGANGKKHTDGSDFSNSDDEKDGNNKDATELVTPQKQNGNLPVVSTVPDKPDATQTTTTPGVSTTTRRTLFPSKKKNSLSQTAEKEQEEEELNVPSPNTTKRQPLPTVAPIASKKLKVSSQAEREQAMVQQWRDELNDLLPRALSPLVTFLGMVATRLRYDDARLLMQWPEGGTGKESVTERLKVVKEAKNVEEFIDKNRFLGTTFLATYISTYKEEEENEEQEEEEEEEEEEEGDETKLEKMNDGIDHSRCFNVRRDLDPSRLDDLVQLTSQRGGKSGVDNALQRAVEQLLNTEMERAFAPAWAFEVLDSSIFRVVLSTTSLGAFEAAQSQVNRIPGCSTFTTKELICSPQVSDVFAFLVSSVYLASGEEAPRNTGAGGRGGRRNNSSTYINLMQMRRKLGDQIYTAKIWFESVRAKRSPLLDAFEEERKRRLDAFNLNKDDILSFIINDFTTEPDFDKITKTREIIRQRLQAYFPTFTNNIVKFQNVYNLNTSTNVEKEAAMTILIGDYDSAWQQILSMQNVDDIENEWKQKAKDAYSKNLDAYKNMLPQRELVYRG